MAILVIVLFMACQEEVSSPEAAMHSYPAAVDFNEESSDSKAMALADSVMQAMGGYDAYDKTRFIKWNFFGARRHIWDKHTGDLRIIGLRDTFDINMNIHYMSGDVSLNDRTLTDQDSLEDFLQKGKEMWINDSYWLLMPYKLKDSGVTLHYLGRDTMTGGKTAEVLSLTFENVGVTPQNKYHVYIDPADYLIKQWDFYSNATDTIPRFSTPWTEYKKYGEILLSGNRGQGRSLTEIAVGDSLEKYIK